MLGMGLMTRIVSPYFFNNLVIDFIAVYFHLGTDIVMALF